MLRFRRMRRLQKFAAVHGTLHNHFNQQRHLTSRETYKANRFAALTEWQSLLIPAALRGDRFRPFS